MSDEKEAQLQKAYDAVAVIEPEIEELMKSEEAGLSLTPDGKTSIRDAIVAYRRLLSQLANVLCQKIDEQAEALTKAKVEGTLTEKILAAAEETPEGALIVSGEVPNELTVLALRKVSEDLLERLVKAAKAAFAGGTDDALAVVERTATTKHLHHWDNRPYGFEGYPHVGSVVVQKVKSGKMRKAATGPEEPENPLHGLGEYLGKAAAAKANRQVKLT